MVWTNRGTRNHSVTEGDPIFRIYLPLVLHGMGTSTAYAIRTTTLDPDYTPIFDSGPIMPGGRFTHTFPSTGTFAYYSAYSPGNVVGTITVVEAGEQVSETVGASAGATVTTTNGAQVEIASNGLYTDTNLSITVLPNLPVTSTWGTSVGPTYDIDVDYADAISGPITITLPYDPGALPDGAEESYLRMSYFNGLSWIMKPGMVDAGRDVIVVTTTHLSAWWIFYPSCSELRAEDVFTEDQKLFFDAGRDYLYKLAAHKDLIEAFKADGEAPLLLLQVDQEPAMWLAEKDLCALSRTSPEELSEQLKVTVNDWTQVAEAMIDVGEALNSTKYDEIKIRDMVNRLGEVPGYTGFALRIVEWSGGPFTALTD